MFAGFPYPKYCVELPRTTLQKRLEDYKGYKSKTVNRLSLEISPYLQNKPCHLEMQETQGRGFYLDDHGMPDLRWKFADKVDGSRIDHHGWYETDEGDGDTIRGLVMSLPHARGFLAGWTMGIGMCSEIDYHIYDDQIDAARAADKIAKHVAEESQDYNALSSARSQFNDIVNETIYNFDNAHDSIYEIHEAINDSYYISTITDDKAADLIRAIFDEAYTGLPNYKLSESQTDVIFDKCGLEPSRH